MKHNSKNYLMLTLKVIGLLGFIVVMSGLNIHLEKEKKKKYDDEVKKLNSDWKKTNDNDKDSGHDDGSNGGEGSGEGEGSDAGEGGVEGFDIKEKYKNKECVIEFKFPITIVYYIIYYVLLGLWYIVGFFLKIIWEQFVPKGLKKVLQPLVQVYTYIFKFVGKFLRYILAFTFRIIDAIAILIFGLLGIIPYLLVGIQSFFGLIFSFFYAIPGFSWIGRFFTLFCWSKTGAYNDYVETKAYISNFFNFDE